VNPFQSRQQGLTGSVIVAQGQSGTGKTHLLTDCWLKSAMLFGGCAFAIAPVDDIYFNVESYRIGYERKLNSLRKDKRTVERGDAINNAMRCLDFMRDNVLIFRDAQECFDAVTSYVNDAPDSERNSGKPQFSLFVDEGAIARKESQVLDYIGPLARNLRGIVYLSAHRSMAMPPQIRAVRRAVILWRSSDGTGDDDIDNMIQSTPGFQFSPVMGDTEESQRFYRGFRFMPEGPQYFQFNPYTEAMPDWMLLPALPTGIKPRILT
jgi:hypothetical protein